MRKIFALLILTLLINTNAISKDLRVAYFLEWPTPNLEDKGLGVFDRELGARVYWKNFSTGGDMFNAMQAGSIDIAFSAGIVPFAKIVSSGSNIKMLGVSAFYQMNGTDCIVGKKSGINSNNANLLEGKSVALPRNTMAEYVFTVSMIKLGVDTNKINIIDTDYQKVAKLLKKNKVDMVCTFGSKNLLQAKKYGRPLLSRTEKYNFNIRGVDGIFVTESYLSNNKDLVSKFLEITHKANSKFNSNSSNINVIAKESSMSVSDATATMRTLSYPTANEQKKYLQGEDFLYLVESMSQMFGGSKSQFVSSIDTSLLGKNIKIAKKDPKPKKKKPKISIDDNKVVPAASGTGFFVSNTGHIITNHHVIEGCDNNKVSFKGKEIDSNVLAIDKMNDLAILKTNIRPSKVYPVANEDASLLEDIIIAGYPLGKKVSAAIKTSKGSVTALAGYGDNYSEFQTDAALNQGNSGGPIMNQKGNVVGVAVANYGKKQGVESFNFGIKSSTLKTFASANGLTFLPPNNRDLSNKDLGKLITEGTVYLECFMTVAKIKRMIAEAENRKAFFTEYQ